MKNIHLKKSGKGEDKMKKIIASLLAICICAVLLVGCGETTTQETPNNTQTAETSGNVQVTETVTSEPATVLVTGDCGENITWTWDDSETLTLSGEGDMINFTEGGGDYKNSSGDVPWNGFYQAIETLVVEEGITSIGDYSFAFCLSLENVVLPDSLNRIGDYAFNYCTALQSLVIPDSVTSLGKWAFNSSYSLQSIVIGDGLTEIPDRAFTVDEQLHNGFYQTSKLKEVTFGKNIQTISPSAFPDSEETHVNSLIFTGNAVEDITNIDHASDCVLYYPKDNSTWVDSGVFANWDGKVEGY